MLLVLDRDVWSLISLIEPRANISLSLVRVRTLFSSFLVDEWLGEGGGSKSFRPMGLKLNSK